MPMKTKFLLLFILIGTVASAQKKDTTGLVRRGFICQFTYNFQTPGGDFAARFGNGHTVGAGVYYKASSNWVFGVEGNYLFGAPVREQGIFDAITNEQGYAVNTNGGLVYLEGKLRGFNLMGKVGKIIPLSRFNQNSGIMLSMSGGYIEHYIRLSNQTSNVTALKGDLAYGYDRLCAGFLLTEFIGYQHLSHNKRVNFFAGFEFGQGFTESKRAWNYDLNKPLPGRRQDNFISFRFGWLLPIYTGASNPSKGYTFK